MKIWKMDLYIEVSYVYNGTKANVLRTVIINKLF